MRIAFLGTPDFAVTCLAELVASGHEIVAVYSQPPAPRGRGQELKPSPVHAFAEGLGLPVRTPVSMKTPEEIEAFQALDLDAAVVVAFGQILVKAVLDAPTHGCFNLHASLLPRWRGAAPIQRAIMAGDPVTGVQVMRMSEGLDEGPILMSEQVVITADDTVATLHDKLAEVGARLLPVALAAIARGGARETPRPKTASPTPRRSSRPRPASTGPARPPRSTTTSAACRPSPAPGSRRRRTKGPVRVKALLSRVETASGAAGTALDDRLLIACGEGSVRLLKAQREGKGVQDAETFTRGFPIAAERPLA
jgi:methionyl-tRNA formyltransferase